jgi:O-antigen ligase
VIRSPASQRLQQTIPLILAAVAVSLYTIGVVALFASGRLSVVQGGILLAIPAVTAIALLRPEWTILVLLLLPPFVISAIPPMQLVAIVAATVFGSLLQGGLSLGPRTGIYPLVAIVVLATLWQADVSVDVELIAGGLLKTILYYTLLMLASFLAVTNGRLSVDAVVTFFLVGLIGAVILQPFVGEERGMFGGLTQTPYRGQFAYLAVMGFGMAYLRLSSARSPRVARLDAILAACFLVLTAIGFGRAAWIAALWIFALASIWTGKKLFWIVASIVLVLILSVPVVSERVLPGGDVAALADQQTLARVTTGRSELWGELWERARDALPLGQGWGYIPSLDSMEIFGFEGNFQADESALFVYPHNDFLYLFVELGIFGVGLLILFWLSLFRKIRVLSRSPDAENRAVRIIVPIIITMFLVQLFDNGFAIRFVGTPFFVAAGVIAGVYALDRDRSRVASARFRIS